MKTVFSLAMIYKTYWSKSCFQLFVLDDTFNAKQAKEYGIANQVCQPNELLSIAEKTAIAIASLPTDAVMTSRRLISQETQLSLPRIIESEGDEFSRLVKTDACKKIMSMFFKKQ